MNSFSLDQVLAALRRLAELAKEKSIELNLCIYGGCAMMLAFDRKRITRDVDAIFHPVEEVKPLIRRVAEEQNLPSNWLNDHVKQFLGTREATRTLPWEFPGMQVTAPTAGYLLAMKALACRRALPGYKGDEEDLRFLIIKMKIKRVEDIQKWIDKFYPDDLPSEASRALLLTLIKEVNR